MILSKKVSLFIMKLIKILLSLLFSFLILVLLYFFVAYLLSKFPKNQNIETAKEHTVYLLYDDVHTDIILNIEESTHPWEKDFPEVRQNPKKGYFSFGWGDRETYLNTPTWAELKLSVALQALFINSPSLIHVNYFSKIKNFQGIYPIKVTQKQHQHIEKLILKSFGEKINFVHKGYWSKDAFYDSPYPYNLFHTCNSWTGKILRESNVSMSYWTPLSMNVRDALLKQK